MSGVYPDRRAAKAPIDPGIFRGALQFFPFAQRFPDNHEIHVRAPELASLGICALVVWAHFVLGIGVCVRSRQPQSHTFSEVMFGSGGCPIQIHADPVPGTVPTITLFEVAENERAELFTIKSDTEDVPLASYTGVRARGYGTQRLQEIEGVQEGREAVMIELSLMVCGLASLLLSNSCYVDNITSDVSKPKMFIRDDHRENQLVRPTYSEPSFMEAATWFFDFNPLPDIFCYQAILERRTWIRPFDPVPEPVKEYFRASNESTAESIWRKTYPQILHLVVTLAALTQVQNLEGCDDFTLLPQIAATTNMSNHLMTWGGGPELSRPLFHILPNAWMSILGLLMEDNLFRTELGGNVALRSRRGWSVFVSTFGVTDPVLAHVGQVIIKGVPYRLGVRKHNILDSDDPPWLPGSKPGTLAKLYDSGVADKLTVSHIPVTNLRPLCAQPNDNFVVKLRFWLPKGSITYDAGYAQIWRALWQVHKTDLCQHDPQNPPALTLDNDTIVIRDYAGELSRDHPALKGARIYVCPTAGHPTSRWYTVWWLARNWTQIGDGVLLRAPGCCGKCAVMQALPRQGSWFVVL